MFQDGGRSPSWNCFPCFWTTHEAYLVAFTGVQNLVGIHLVFGLKMHIHASNYSFGVFNP